MATLNDNNITSTDDLMTAIHTWLTSTLTNTWNSVDGIDTGANTLDLDIGNLFVQFSWTTSRVDMSQSTASSTPVTFDGEAGNVGHTSEAFFPIVVTSAELWGFANDTATTTDRYAHFVVEFNKDGRYIHFGFGQIDTADKFWAWTGGAYKYGGEWDILTGGFEPWSGLHRFLLDSLPTNTAATANLATMRVEDLAGQPVTSKYGVFSEGSTTTIEGLTDDDGDALCALHGMSRYGPWVAMASFQRGSPNNAAIHLIPVMVGFRDTGANYMPLGRMPDVRICNIGNIQPKDQLTFDSETWQFFPWGQKLTLTSDQDILATRHGGVAYKVT